MKTFTASRVSDGNGMFPCKIIVGEHKITVRIPGLFHNKDKDIPFDKISEVSVDTPLVGYSTITFYTTGVGHVKAHGFTKSEVKEIKSLIDEGGEDVNEDNSDDDSVDQDSNAKSRSSSHEEIEEREYRPVQSKFEPIEEYTNEPVDELDRLEKIHEAKMKILDKEWRDTVDGLGEKD